MDFKSKFKEIDQGFLKESPFSWIIGWHIFLPIIIGLVGVSLVIGFLYPTRIYTSSSGFFELSSVFLGFFAFLVFVLFVIRQIKFNSFRIHHVLPYKKSNFNFFSFFIIIAFLSVIPFIPEATYELRVRMELSSITEDFDKDLEILNKGIPFFSNEYSTTVIRDDSVFFKKTNSFVSYRFNKFKNPITANEALIRISDFIVIADKYDMHLSEREPENILELRKKASRGSNFNILTIKESLVTNSNNSIHGSRMGYRSYEKMLTNYHDAQHSYFRKGGPILGISLFAIIIAVLLWIFISVSLPDFGLAVLVGALMPVAIGLITFLSYTLTESEVVVRIVLYGSALVVLFLAFKPGDTSRLKRIMQILSQVVLPILISVITLEVIEFIRDYDNKYGDLWLFFIFILILLPVFFYKNVYGKNRILPK